MAFAQSPPLQHAVFKETVISFAVEYYVVKGFGFPLDVCLKFERLVGIPPGGKPDFWQRMQISHEMVKALRAHVAHISLTDKDWELIRQEIAENERKKPREIEAAVGISEEEMVNTLTDSLKRDSVMQENADAGDR